MTRPAALLLAAAVALTNGCAALTNPVADGIPVRRLPAEVLGRPKADMRPISLTLLRQKEAEVYKVDKGDVLAVVADQVIVPYDPTRGDQAPIPPVKLPDQVSNTAALGYPIPVSDDGTISVPGLKPIPVKGKTPAEIEQLIRDAAIGRNGNPKLLPEDQRDVFRVSVQIYTKRRYKVLVSREDAVPFTAGGGGPFGTAVTGVSKRSVGQVLYLEAGQNDVLTALNQTGGLPGNDAKNEVIIERGQYDPANPEAKVTRIPLRLYPEQQLTLRDEDIILKDGDIVRIEARDTEVYHTAGLLFGNEIPLPRDRDLRVLEAIAQIRGPLLNGAFSQNLFVGNAINSGVGTPSPSRCSVLRKLADGRQINIRVDLNRAFIDPRENILIQPGDFLVLQESPGEAITRYLTQSFRLGTTVDVIRAASLNSTLTGNNP
jgi:protein involved in polysaccharide export with SLBB domain